MNEWNLVKPNKVIASRNESNKIHELRMRIMAASNIDLYDPYLPSDKKDSLYSALYATLEHYHDNGELIERVIKENENIENIAKAVNTPREDYMIIIANMVDKIVNYEDYYDPYRDPGVSHIIEHGGFIGYMKEHADPEVKEMFGIA